MESEIENEFGEFGEIAIRNCFICGKTIRKRNCYDFERKNSNGMISGDPKRAICLKCLLKGVWGICRSKESINEYLDLFIKTSITEDLNDLNQKV